ncbi:LuxR C-terminal-related transcriptional regulator, partial [Nocardioides sp. AE5]|uniref:ATP-binding protein n=1 Tax=Nocardioides sp. AE5 TaxID=2962573 RepID=UPI002881153B
SLTEAPDDRRGASATLYDKHGERIRDLLQASPRATIAEIADALAWPHATSTLAKCVARARTDLGATPAPATAPSAPAHSSGPAPGLPQFSTAFIGRRAELTKLRTLLGEHRLVTITGIGGIGKTRLAVHLAHDVRRAFPDGVRFVELAGLRSPELLAQAVLEGLRLAGRDQHGATAEDALLDHLADRRMLLVLDNCEHLVDATATLVHTLLQGTTDLRIVVTSIEVLALPGEFAFTLDPLPIPDHAGRTEQNLDSAMALFESRADAVLNGFTIDDTNRDAVRRVCQRLDGLPLAIELACARLPVLSVAELADRLDRRLELLTTGNRAAPVRHRSLAATLDWSHDLCTDEQRLLWSRASIFTGGFDLAMAEQVCADDTLPTTQVLDAITALVGKSILVREEVDGAVRFRMLETIREYGQARLDDDQVHALHRRLLDWIHGKVRELVAAWAGAAQVRINTWFRANRANLRAALQWALDAQADPGVRRTAAQVVAEPWFLWAGGFSVREHRLWLARAATGVAGTGTEGQVLATQALVQTLQGEREAATGSLDAAEAIATEAWDEASLDFIAHTRGLWNYFAGDFTAAEPLLLSALERYQAREPRGGLRSALDVHLGMLYAFTGQLDLSQRHFSVVAQRAHSTGERWFRAYAEFGLGVVALMGGEAERAREMAHDGLGLIRDFDDEIGATLILDLFGWSEAVLGNAERAAILVGSASKLWGGFGRQLYGSVDWVEVRDTYVATAREALGPQRYDALHAEGAAKSVTEAIAFALAEETEAPAAGGVSAALAELTRREREVAGLVAEGLSNKEIAARLVLSPRTVEGHVEHALQKLGLTSRTQIAGVLA